MQTPSPTIFRLCNWIIGADFYRAMVATAAWEKLLTGHRPVNSSRGTALWGIGSSYDIKLVLCRKLHVFLGKSTKTAATKAAFLTLICTKWFVGGGFTPADPLGELTALHSTPWLYLGGLLLKGGEGGSSSFALERKKEKSAPMNWIVPSWDVL